jgi:hypothetical protein
MKPHVLDPKNPIIVANSPASDVLIFRLMVSTILDLNTLSHKNSCSVRLTIDDIPNRVKAAHHSNEKDQKPERYGIVYEPAQYQ